MENSFVLILYNYNEETKESEQIARCIGFLNTPDNNPYSLVFNDKDDILITIFNFYHTSGLSEGNAIESLKQIFKDIFNKDFSFKENNSNIKGPYHNPYARWSFYFNNNGRELQYPYTISSNRKNNSNIKYHSCDKCDNEHNFNEVAYQEVDDGENVICPNCYKNVSICEISNKKSIDPLVEIILNKNKFNIIEKFCKIDHLHKCNLCNIKTDVLYNLEDISVCSECVENATTECDICHKLIKDDQIIDLFEESICKECMNPFILMEEFYSNCELLKC